MKEILIAVGTFSLVMLVIAVAAAWFFPTAEVAKIFLPVIFLGYLAIAASALFSGKNKK